MPMSNDLETVPLANGLLEGLDFLFLILYDGIASNTNQMVMMFPITGHFVPRLCAPTKPMLFQQSSSDK